MKRICSNEVYLQRRLVDFQLLLTDKSCNPEIIRPEIQKVIFIDRNSLLKKPPKHQEDSFTLVLAFHPAIHIAFDLLKTVHQHV